LHANGLGKTYDGPKTSRLLTRLVTPSCSATAGDQLGDIGRRFPWLAPSPVPLLRPAGPAASAPIRNPDTLNKALA
jgi:hypothetical protein